MNVVSLASPRLQELYAWLEVDFHPLQLCSRVHVIVEELLADEGSPLQQYVPALQDVTLVRLIRQVSQVYQTIKTERLLELARFASAFHLERLLVDCVRHNDMQVRDVDLDRCHVQTGFFVQQSFSISSICSSDLLKLPMLMTLFQLFGKSGWDCVTVELASLTHPAIAQVAYSRVSLCFNEVKLICAPMKCFYVIKNTI